MIFVHASMWCLRARAQGPSGVVPVLTTVFVKNMLSVNFDQRWLFTLSTFLIGVRVCACMLSMARVLVHVFSCSFTIG